MLSARCARRTASRPGSASTPTPFPPQREEAANEGLSDIRADLTPARYGQFAKAWVQHGADIVGGCCGIGPEHIGALKALRG